MPIKRQPKGQALKTPIFASEAEEARWWVKQQDKIAAEFEKAASDGRLGRGTENPPLRTDH